MLEVLLAKTFGIESNSYIIISGNEAAIVDPSVSLDRFSLDKDIKISKVLLTHGHFDHILSLGDYAKEDTQVYISQADEPMLKDGALNASVLFGLENVSFDVEVNNVRDRDVIPLGDESITVISTPGHTEGSVCYLVGDKLFTGDTLFCGNIGRCDLPGGSYIKMKSSLKKLTSLEGDYRIYPGHDELTYLSKEKKTNYYLLS